LHYLATRPCALLTGEPEDLEILQWATGITQYETSVG
jgi:hypothetical protein